MPNYSMKAEAGSYVAMGQDVKLTHVRLWPSLLSAAERLLDAGEHAAAIIVAQTACEVVVEKAMVKAKGPLANR